MKYLTALVFISLTACSPKFEGVDGVRVATTSQVAGCTRKGTVTGVPGVFGPLKEIGLKDARKRALELAPKIGANTVVFDAPNGDVIQTEVTGSAYACP